MSSQPKLRKFKSAIIPLVIFVFIAAVGIFFIELLIIRGRHLDPRALKVAVGIIAGLSIIVAWVLSVCFPVGFSAEGIYGHSVWGTQRFIAWQEIVKVRRFYMLNLTWLRIYASDGKVTWLALFQSRKAEFQDEIRSFAPPQNPVLESL